MPQGEVRHHAIAFRYMNPYMNAYGYGPRVPVCFLIHVLSVEAAGSGYGSLDPYAALHQQAGKLGGGVETMIINPASSEGLHSLKSRPSSVGRCKRKLSRKCLYVWLNLLE